MRKVVHPVSTLAAIKWRGEWFLRTRLWLESFIRRENPHRISLLDRSTLTLLIVACCWYFVAYFLGSVTPGTQAHDNPGWMSWWDQSQYYKSATDLSHGDLKPEVYWYGYPILAAPFIGFLPRHPFLVPDLCLVLVMVGSFFCACRHFIGRFESWILLAAFVFFEPMLRDECLVIPWNTLPAYAAIYLSAYLLLFAQRSLTGFGVCAFVVGIALFARPTELIPLATIYLLAVASWDNRGRWWALGFFVTAVALVGTLTASLNWHFYHALSSPYMVAERTKFSSSDVVLKVYQLLCDGTFLTGNSLVPAGTRPIQLLERFPYFILLLPGLVYLVKAKSVRGLALILAMVFAVGFYLSYNMANNPPYFWSYGTYHYFWWVMPWLGFLAYLSFRQAPFALARPTYLVALLLPVLTYALIGFKAVELPGTDAVNPALSVATDYKDQTYTVKLIDTAFAGKIADLRLKFQTPPSYFGTAVDSLSKMKVTVNGALQWSPTDYMISQNKNTFDVSFLARRLQVKRGDVFVIQFKQTQQPTLAGANFVMIGFAPGKLLARWWTHRDLD